MAAVALHLGQLAREPGGGPAHRWAGHFAATQPSVRPVEATTAAGRHRRNLVVLRAGDGSLHREWLDGPTRDFDLFISYYGKTPDRHREDADFYEMRTGPKWPCLAALLQEHPALVDRYQAFWFPDDDLSTDGATIDRMFAFFCAYELCLAQPALTRNSYCTWNTLLQDPRCHIRYTGFVEIMAPIFRRDTLRLCAPIFAESRSGWGLDWVWPTLCRGAGAGRIAVIDATPVRHTRPLGGELYRNHPTMDPPADAAQILRAYGIDEVRATAKYAFEGQVRDVALPMSARLLFWLKRLNGQRLRLRHAHGRSELLMTISPMRHLTDVSQPIIGGLVQARACFGLIDARPEPDHGTRELRDFRGDIRFEGVSVQYPGGEAPALQGIDIELPAGGTIALVGPSGAGKSTLVNTLLAFVEPSAGRLTVDGIEIGEIAKASLRRQFAVVSQDIVLFDGSVEDNVVYVHSRATRRASRLRSAPPTFGRSSPGCPTARGRASAPTARASRAASGSGSRLPGRSTRRRASGSSTKRPRRSIRRRRSWSTKPSRTGAVRARWCWSPTG